jgi:hypothetical protein
VEAPSYRPVEHEQREKRFHSEAAENASSSAGVS